MVWLPPGEFQLGSPPGEPGRNPDEQGYETRVPEPIAFGETEVTLWQYRQFVQETGYRTEVERDSTCLRPDDNWQELVPDMTLSWESPGYAVNPGHPVSCVSWNDARAYAQWLSEQTGHLYRLPTELEWEYAARAGTQASRYWGDDPRAGCKRANTAECDDDHTYTAVAGTFAPNPFGLRDMLGNLAEWTCSEYSKGYGGSEAQCSVGGGTAARVFRGGSWLDAPDLVRAAARDGAPPNLGLNTVGFRLVRGLHLDAQ
jgi:formylglycine-generating enzyme required for sulfatase activity